jgi:hypothetical protein
MEEMVVFIAVVLISWGLPFYISWSHPNWKGWLIGLLTLWIFFLMGQVLLLGRYGSGGPGGAMMLLWLIGGWAVSAIFCGLVVTVRQKLSRPRTPSAEPPPTKAK